MVKLPTSARMNTRGASRIPGNATCSTISHIVSFSVSGGPTVFNFSAVSSTVRMEAAIQAWVATGATVQQAEPDPGNDGIFFVGYKVTGPTAGVWHYDYAVFNMNLDRAIHPSKLFFQVFRRI